MAVTVKSTVYTNVICWKFTDISEECTALSSLSSMIIWCRNNCEGCTIRKLGTRPSKVWEYHPG
jgi:hypothetical protein